MSRTLASFNPALGERYLIGAIVYEILTREVEGSYKARVVAIRGGSMSVQLGQTRTIYTDSIADTVTYKTEEAANDMNDNLKWAVGALQDDIEDMDGDEALSYLDDICTHGCQSGIVGWVIYYNDTSRLFKEHMDSILGLLDDMWEEVGANPLGDMDYTDFPNRAVWVSIERAADYLVNNIRQGARDRQARF